MQRLCGDECDKPMDSTVECRSCGIGCHTSCYSINKTVLRAIADMPNLWFLCDVCTTNNANIFSKDANTNAVNTSAPHNCTNDNTAIFQALDELKNMVIELQGKVNGIEKPTYRSILAGNNGKPAGSVNSNAKRRRFADTENVHSTPPGRPKNAIVGSNLDDGGLSSVEPRKWMFVSQLHPSTSDKSFVEYVKKRLNDTDNKLNIQAYALVPRDKNRDSLNFISFKLNVPESSIDAILKPDNWPKGVIIREFVNDDRRRRPTGRLLLNTPQINLMD